MMEATYKGVGYDENTTRLLLVTILKYSKGGDLIPYGTIGDMKPADIY